MKKYTYVPGAFIAVWLIWELVVRIGGFNEALLPTPYKVLLGFGELIGDGVFPSSIVHGVRDSEYRSRIHQGGSKFWYQAAGIVI